MNSLQWLQLVRKTCLVLFFHRIIFASILKNENVAKPAESRSSIITRLQKLCHVFSLFLTCCSLGALLRRIQVLVLCLPPAYLSVCVYVCELCMCLCDIFPLQFSLLFGTLTARLLFAYLPAYLPTWQFHNVPPNMWGSLSLSHTNTNAHPVCRSLSATSHWAAILMCASEWASMPKRTRWARVAAAAAATAALRERALLSAAERQLSVAANMKKGLSVAGTFASFQLLSCAWSFCLVFVCARQIATRAVCWPTILHTYTYNTHTHTNK